MIVGVESARCGYVVGRSHGAPTDLAAIRAVERRRHAARTTRLVARYPPY